MRQNRLPLFPGHGISVVRSILLTALFVATVCTGRGLAAETPLPNIVLIFCDDLGYGDLGCYGATGYETPHLDGLAKEGRKFTSFYVAQAVCGASRAALMTGCYSNRVGILGAPGPRTRWGIHADEVLIPEICKQKNYATAIIGKWHLGHHHPFLPLQHGFDEYFGLPYSNDMWPYHPERPDAYPDLPLVEGNVVKNPRVTAEDQKNLTTWYTERAVDFIRRKHEQPFFLYLAHSMPHVPLFVSEKYQETAPRGLFGDVLQEIDWSVGQILDALDELGISENTLVIFTSDNGPWLSYGNHAGSAGPFREGKATAWEGGVRVPCLMRWPGRISAGTECSELAATIDILPTIAELIGAELPDHPIDGLSILPLMMGEDVRTPHESYCYFWVRELHAIRSGDWKLHFPHSYRTLTEGGGRDGMPSRYSQRETGLELYDLKNDPGETTDVSGQHPDVVARLQQLAEAVRADLGDSLQQRDGPGRRQHGSLDPE